LLAALLAATQLLAAAEPELPDPGSVPGISKQQQEQLGLTAMRAVYQQMPVLSVSSPVTGYVQELGQRLQAVIPQPYSWPYQFHVVAEKEVNSFALPGGPIFITAGTMIAAANEAELAAVMAHEMSHVYLQHSLGPKAQGASPSVLDDTGTMLTDLFGSIAGALTHTAAEGGAAKFMTKYSRADESQADAVGAIILYQAGYNPLALAGFFKKLEQPGSGIAPQWLSYHPNPGNREAALQAEIRGWPAKPWRHDSAQFLQAQDQAKAARIYTAQAIGEGAKQGLWAQQNSAPGASPAEATPSPTPAPAAGGISAQKVPVSGHFVRLQTAEYRISYPENWQVLRDQHSAAATIAPPGGFARDAVAYGVVINQFLPPAANEPLAQAAADLISSITQQSPELRVAGNPQEITVREIRGRSVELMGISPVQQNGKAEAEHDWLVALPRSAGGLLYLVFVSPEGDFAYLRPVFQRMLRSLRVQ